MISSLVKAMLSYAKLEPSMAKDAMKLATNAADFLISITYSSDTAVEGLPPTYCFKGLNRETVNKTAPMAERRENTLMLIYPAGVGEMYLELEKVTGDTKYFEAAKKIAEYYKAIPSSQKANPIIATTFLPSIVSEIMYLPSEEAFFTPVITTKFSRFALTEKSSPYLASR